MIRATLVTLACSLMPALGLAQDRGAPDPGKAGQTTPVAGQFFYSLPEEAGDEWAYAVPECRALTPSASGGIHGCTAFDKHQLCESSKSVVLTNVLNKEKRRFTLIYHVFSTKKACAQGRQAALNSE